MALEILHEELPGNITLLTLQGIVDHFSYPKVQAALQKILEAKQSRIAVDLSHVDYMSSAGVGVLITYREEARNSGGELIGFSPAPRVKAALDVLGIEYQATREDALAALGAGPEMPIPPAP